MSAAVAAGRGVLLHRRPSQSLGAGKVADWKIPLGPSTPAQIAVAVGGGFLLINTISWWSWRGPIPIAAWLLSIWAVRRPKIAGRASLQAALGWVLLLWQPRSRGEHQALPAVLTASATGRCSRELCWRWWDGPLPEWPAGRRWSADRGAGSSGRLRARRRRPGGRPDRWAGGRHAGTPSGGCSSTRGLYSTSWMRPSNVRWSIISRATSG